MLVPGLDSLAMSVAPEAVVPHDASRMPIAAAKVIQPDLEVTLGSHQGGQAHETCA